MATDPPARRGALTTVKSRPRALMTVIGAGDGTLPVSAALFGGCCGRSSMVELQPSKLVMRVRFPSPAPARWLFSIYCSSSCYLMRPTGRYDAQDGISPSQIGSSNRVM